MHSIKMFPGLTIRRVHYHSIHHIMWMMSCHVLNSFWWYEYHLKSKCDWEVYKFSMCEKSYFPANFGFITSMLTCSTFGQLCILKVVQHAEVWTHINFLYPRPGGFIMDLAAYKFFFNLFPSCKMLLAHSVIFSIISLTQPMIWLDDEYLCKDR